MKDLKIVSRGHLGYVGLILGIVLILLSIYAFFGGAIRIYIIEIPISFRFSGDWLLYFIGGAMLTAKGIREAGKPLIRINDQRIECQHARARILIPLKRVEKVVWEKDVILYLHVTNFKEVVRISFSSAPREKVDLLEQRFSYLHLEQEFVPG